MNKKEKDKMKTPSKHKLPNVGRIRNAKVSIFRLTDERRACNQESKNFVAYDTSEAIVDSFEFRMIC